MSLDPGPSPAALRGPLRAHLSALPLAWQRVLAPTLASVGAHALAAFVDARITAGRTVFPPRPLAALQDLDPAHVRVVILGQDPYHGPGQAQGYAFAVPTGVRPPPSLRNILQEVARDTGRPARSTALTGWSGQGVLLLNTVLTVEQGAAASHAGHGWEAITDAILQAVAAQAGPRAYLLWGAQAQAKQALIGATGATVGTPPLVLQANHPSPLSARRPPRPFLGCGHFTQVNRYLSAHGLEPIDWSA